jgi:hypothetical protein
MVIEVIDRAICSEDEPAAVRELECTRLEAVAPGCGLPRGLAVPCLLSHRGLPSGTGGDDTS